MQVLKDEMKQIRSEYDQQLNEMSKSVSNPQMGDQERKWNKER